MNAGPEQREVPIISEQTQLVNLSETLKGMGNRLTFFNAGCNE